MLCQKNPNLLEIKFPLCLHQDFHRFSLPFNLLALLDEGFMCLFMCMQSIPAVAFGPDYSNARQKSTMKCFFLSIPWHWLMKASYAHLCVSDQFLQFCLALDPDHSNGTQKSTMKCLFFTASIGMDLMLLR